MWVLYVVLCGGQLVHTNYSCMQLMWQQTACLHTDTHPLLQSKTKSVKCAKPCYMVHYVYALLPIGSAYCNYGSSLEWSAESRAEASMIMYRTGANGHTDTPY